MKVNNPLEKELKKYYSDISKAILCTKKQKTDFIFELKSSVKEYISVTDNATIETITATFGTPEEIGESFLENTANSVIKRKLDIKKAVILFLIALLLIYILFIAASLIDVHTEAYGYIKESIMTIDILKGGKLL